MRRRLALLILPLAALLWFFRPRLPTDNTVNLHFGPTAPSLRQADLHFTRDGSVLRDLTLHFATRGAPETLTRTIRLAPGDYEVGIRLSYQSTPERHITRSCKAGSDEGAGCDLDLR